jgi:hypothetical protein
MAGWTNFARHSQRTQFEAPWLTHGFGGIGSASFLAAVDHEVPTALMARLVTDTLGAPLRSG